MTVEQLRKLVLGFPGVAERQHHGRPDFRVNDLSCSTRCEQRHGTVSHTGQWDATVTLEDFRPICVALYHFPGSDVLRARSRSSLPGDHLGAAEMRLDASVHHGVGLP